MCYFDCLLLQKKSQDLQCLLTKNMVKACKSMIFDTVQGLINIESIEAEFFGYSVC
jgi:hypothetical protein